jgi:hypothetical protein
VNVRPSKAPKSNKGPMLKRSMSVKIVEELKIFIEFIDII